MKRNHILGMACGYYLSRFDAEAYRSLGLGNQQETHRARARSQRPGEIDQELA